MPPWITEGLSRRGDGRDVLNVGSGQGIDVYEYAWCDATVTGLPISGACGRDLS